MLSEMPNERNVTSRLRGALAVISCAGALAFAACGGADNDRAPPDVPDDRMVVEAPIQDLNLITSADIPTQYSVAITSGLPNGCAEFHDGRITGNTGTLITVEITNTVPKDPNVVCSEVYGTHQSLLNLGSSFTPGTLYTVRVNTGEVRFTPE